MDSTIAAAGAPLTVCFEDEVLIPPEVGEHAAFRRWILSDARPERGRIDYLSGRIEVDMSPEELQTHGVPKGRLYGYIDGVVTGRNLGQLFVDSTLLSSTEAGLTCEPDVLFVSWEALRSGRVRYLPGPAKRPGRKMEVEGAADLAVEVVSDTSEGKDTRRLPPLYAAAGVRELWLADARGPQVQFRIFHLHEGAYREAPADAGGFRESRVLGRRLRLRREPGPVAETWVYFVDEA
jgi:Uma2 family endonuclease